MNKPLFEQLTEKAGFIRFTKEENPYTPIDWSCDYSKDLENFYMLVVQECIEAVMEGERWRREYFADKIRQRLGVEHE